MEHSAKNGERKRVCVKRGTKGPGKRGHIVADTLLSTQMFPRLPARATFVADTNFVSGIQKNASGFVQKHFVSATNVSQFAQPKKHHEQQCVRNNVSSFTRVLTRQLPEPPGTSLEPTRNGTAQNLDKKPK